MVLDLLLIRLASTLEPFPLTAFILLLSSERGGQERPCVHSRLACLVLVLAAALLATGGDPPGRRPHIYLLAT